MITERIATEIAHLFLNPIIERLSQRARQEIAEKFCQPKCGHGPEGNFCPEAYITYGRFLRLQFAKYASLN